MAAAWEQLRTVIGQVAETYNRLQPDKRPDVSVWNGAWEAVHQTLRAQDPAALDAALMTFNTVARDVGLPVAPWAPYGTPEQTERGARNPG